MENEINGWKTSNDVFRGYTKAKLEQILAELTLLCAKVSMNEARILKLELAISNKQAVTKAMVGLAAAVGSAFTMIMTFLVKVLHIFQ